MSLDLWLEVDAGGHEPVYIEPIWNYTYNCSGMWRAAGIDLAECIGRDAGGAAEGLEGAIANLKADPARFKAMNPPNGWGSYDSLVEALEELLTLWKKYPKARIAGCR